MESETCRSMVEGVKNHHLLPEHSNISSQTLPRHAYNAEGKMQFIQVPRIGIEDNRLPTTKVVDI